MASRILCGGCREYFDRADGFVSFGLGRFCTSECLSSSLDGKRRKATERKLSVVKRPPKPRRGLDPSLRAEVRLRDGDHCRFCGSSRGLQLHHVMYRSEGGPDEASNLITLCDEHHRLAHSNKRLWKPVLLATIWLTYAGLQLTVPEVARRTRSLGLLVND